jgi:ABC-2 type transport system permease protein
MSAVGELVLGPVKSLTRITAQVRKELIQVIRRPAAFFSLVLGPFLIMALFGLGYTGVRRALDTVVVVPPAVSLPREASYYQELAGPAIHVVTVTDNPDAARTELQQSRLDMIVVAPPDLEERFRAGQRAEILIEINDVDPTNAGYADFLAQHLTKLVNQEILIRAVQEGESYALRRTGQELTDIPPDVIAAPTVSRVVNMAPVSATIVTFAAPAVLALILQHMAVTLTALSFVRERMSGALELMRVSPVNSLELVLGKYLGLGIVSAVIAVVSTLLLVGVLGVPLLGDPWLLAAVVALLVFASLGVGLIISVISDSERQAVQLSLLVLLASVFFSGFVLPVHEFRPALQVAAYSLPVTHGIALLQDVMLRGGTYQWWQVGVLALLGLALLMLTALLLRRTMRHI